MGDTDSLPTAIIGSTATLLFLALWLRYIWVHERPLQQQRKQQRAKERADRKALREAERKQQREAAAREEQQWRKSLIPVTHSEEQIQELTAQIIIGLNHVTTRDELTTLEFELRQLRKHCKIREQELLRRAYSTEARRKVRSQITTLLSGIDHVVMLLERRQFEMGRGKQR